MEDRATLNTSEQRRLLVLNHLEAGAKVMGSKSYSEGPLDLLRSLLAGWLQRGDRPVRGRWHGRGCRHRTRARELLVLDEVAPARTLHAAAIVDQSKEVIERFEVDGFRDVRLKNRREFLVNGLLADHYVLCRRRLGP